MSKRILLIDSDESFNADLVSAITARGFTATTATDSEQGMSLAKEEPPDLIVVCVEAQPTNGYMLCTRLKKDEQLKGIPVILTSANATADSFEKHKKLKTRAEEYLIKPFEPQAMLEKASALLGAAAPEASEEILAVQDEVDVQDLSNGEEEAIALSAADAAEARNGGAEDALDVEEVEEIQVQEEQAQGDDDLELFDKAFDSLGGAPAPEQTSRFSDLTAAPAVRDVAARPPKPEKKQPSELSAPDDDAVLNSLEPERAAADAKHPIDPREKELVSAQEKNARLEAEVQQLKEQVAQRDAASKALQQRADALSAAAKKFERDLSVAREEAKRAGRSAETEQKVADLESEVTGLREQVAALMGEKEVLAESRDELRKQLEEAQSTAEQNEDRAVKAYSRIKADGKLREKARKALQIALQLLEESGDDEEDSASKKLA